MLVSFKPDWEPRHLLSVLGDVTGLPVTGYLRAGPDKFVSLGKALARSMPVDTSRGTECNRWSYSGGAPWVRWKLRFLDAKTSREKHAAILLPADSTVLLYGP
ncbi:MAG: hypothetical protein Ct9H300mP15_22680 [Gemmatimonadota bacterium]|nr:MAG: hypothetical protein Ct9H300mP15_22680 [Gemmatimonadota bacterium]